MNKRESRFLAELKRGYEGRTWHKISDQIGNRFTHKKPYDAFFLFGGTFVALEAKFWDGRGTFDLRVFKEHQIEGLLGVVEDDCLAYGVVRMPGPRAFYMEATVIEHLLKKGVERLALEEVEKIWGEFNRKKVEGIAWNLRPLVGL